MRILVTGATGNVGVPVVKALSEAGHSVVAISRDPSSSSSKALATLKGVEVTTLDHAFDTPIDRVFLSFAVTVDQFVWETDFLIRCKDAGVKYIVKISTTGPFMSVYSHSFYGRSHLAIEHFLDLGDIPFTTLRPTTFFSYLGLDIGSAKKTKGFKAALGKCEIAPIDPADVGNAAVALLLLDDPSPHFCQKYFLEGPEYINGEKMAEILSDVLKEKIAFNGGFSPEEYISLLTSLGYEAKLIKTALPVYMDLQNKDTKGSFPTHPSLLSLAPPKITYKEYLTKLSSNK